MQIPKSKTLDIESISFLTQDEKREELIFESPAREFYLYTNIMNLPLFLSAGFIHPRSFYEQDYSRDFSTYNSKGILLFTRCVNFEALEKAKEEGYHHPVCIVISVSSAYNDFSIIDKEYSVRAGSIADLKENDIALFIPGALSLKYVKSIYFPDNQKKEFFLKKKNMFENCPFVSFEFVSAPDKFTGENYDHLILEKISDSIYSDLPGSEYFGKKFVEFNRVISILPALITAIEKFKSFKYLSDYLMYLALLPSSTDIISFKKAYKLIEKENVIYEGFRFTENLNLLFPLFACKYSASDSPENIRLFMKDAFGDKQRTNEFNSGILTIIIFRELLNWDINNTNFKLLFNNIQNAYTVLAENDKKKSKKSNDISSVFNDINAIFNYECDVSVASSWPVEFASLKSLLLFVFNPGLENTLLALDIYSQINFSESEQVWALIFSSVYDGYYLLHSSRKTKIAHILNIIDASLHTFGLGVNLGKNVLKPTISDTLDDTGKTRQHIFNLSGFFGNSIIYKETEKTDELVELILSNTDPVNCKPLVQLARHIGFNEFINVNIYFDPAYMQFTAYTNEKNKEGKLTVKENTFRTDFSLDISGFKEKLQAEKDKLNLLDLPFEIRSEIIGLYKSDNTNKK